MEEDDDGVVLRSIQLETRRHSDRVCIQFLNEWFVMKHRGIYASSITSTRITDGIDVGRAWSAAIGWKVRRKLSLSMAVAFVCRSTQIRAEEDRGVEVKGSKLL